MALLKYFKKIELSQTVDLPDLCNLPEGSHLSKLDVEMANAKVKSVKARDDDCHVHKRERYENYTNEERAQIGKYASMHGPTKASKHFSKQWSRNVAESTARHLKKEYLKALQQQIRN